MADTFTFRRVNGSGDGEMTAGDRLPESRSGMKALGSVTWRVAWRGRWSSRPATSEIEAARRKLKEDVP